MDKKLITLLSGIALLGAFAVVNLKEATAQEQQGPRWNIRTSAEFMPNSTREVPDRIDYIEYIDERGSTREETIIIPGGMRGIRN